MMMMMMTTMMMMDRRNNGGVAIPRSVGVEEELSLPILLADRVRKSAQESDSCKSECSEVGKKSDLLADLLRSAARQAAASSSLYDRPLRRISAEASKALERAYALVLRCRRLGPLRRVIAATTASADFRKILSLLDASLGDLRWLLSLYSEEDFGLSLSLPPIASNDPILSWVWSHIAAVQMGASVSDRAEAASALAKVDGARNKKIIVEEGGVPPLLSLLRDGPSLEARVAAANALSNLAVDPDNVPPILSLSAVPILVGILAASPIELQTRAAVLVRIMASSGDLVAREEFARGNAIRPLVSLLSSDLDPVPYPVLSRQMRTSVGIGSSSNEQDPEVKLELKLACSEALWMLSRGCISNCRRITEIKGLLCLSRIIEKEKGELQYNCVMTVVEIAASAESDADFRCAAFKTNSPASRAAVDQLLLLVLRGNSVGLQIAALKAVGSLARTFPARETRVLSPLVEQLGHWNPDVAVEATRALIKFASPQNFLCLQHSKAIIEFSGVPLLLRLLRAGEKTQLPALTLLCYLASHVPNSVALEQSKVLGTLESVARTAMAEHPSIKELLPSAIYHLEIYRVGMNSNGPA